MLQASTPKDLINVAVYWWADILRDRYQRLKTRLQESLPPFSEDQLTRFEMGLTNLIASSFFTPGFTLRMDYEPSPLLQTALIMAGIQVEINRFFPNKTNMTVQYNWQFPLTDIWTIFVEKDRRGNQHENLHPFAQFCHVREISQKKHVLKIVPS